MLVHQYTCNNSFYKSQIWKTPKEGLSYVLTFEKEGIVRWRRGVKAHWPNAQDVAAQAGGAVTVPVVLAAATGRRNCQQASISASPWPAPCKPHTRTQQAGCQAGGSMLLANCTDDD
jgi:hypothetical protein